MSTKIRTVVVDDEPDAVSFIRSLIDEYCPELAFVGSAGSAIEGIRLINEVHPDLLFVDVEMPHGNGFDLLARFPQKDFSVVFITAFNQYALKAIKFSAVDYILKPINIGEFIEAVAKVSASRKQASGLQANYLELLENLKSALPTRLAIPTADGMEYLNPHDIVRIEADRSYSWFYLTGDRKYLVSRNLKEYQDLLGERQFFRPHHSHLINLEHVKKYFRHDGGYIEMADGSHVPVSRVKRELFLLQMSRMGQ